MTSGTFPVVQGVALEAGKKPECALMQQLVEHCELMEMLEALDDYTVV